MASMGSRTGYPTMPTFFNFISQYFWLFFIGFTIANALIWRFHARRFIAADPTLESSYRRLIRGYLIWLNIPWLVMGASILGRGVTSLWDYFRPQDGNPHVVLWFTLVLFIQLAGIYWIFAKSGAEELERHPGWAQILVGPLHMKAGSIKLLSLLIFASFPAAVYIFFTMDVRIPPFVGKPG